MSDPLNEEPESCVVVSPLVTVEHARVLAIIVTGGRNKCFSIEGAVLRVGAVVGNITARSLKIVLGRSDLHASTSDTQQTASAT